MVMIESEEVIRKITEVSFEYQLRQQRRMEGGRSSYHHQYCVVSIKVRFNSHLRSFALTHFYSTFAFFS